MRRPFVAGNWKMHGSRAENAELIEGVAARRCRRQAAAEVAVCPPFVYLWEVGTVAEGFGYLRWVRSRCLRRSAWVRLPARFRQRC